MVFRWQTRAVNLDVSIDADNLDHTPFSLGILVSGGITNEPFVARPNRTGVRNTNAVDCRLPTDDELDVAGRDAKIYGGRGLIRVANLQCVFQDRNVYQSALSFQYGNLAVRVDG